MKRWSRKGRCPGCNVSTGSNHSYGCAFVLSAEDVRTKYKSQMGLKRTIWERDRYICYYCRKNMREEYFKWRQGEIKRMDCDLTVDHIIPRSKGGLWEYTNLVTACRLCNLEKGSKLISAPLLRARIAIHNFVDFVFAKIDSIRHN